MTKENEYLSLTDEEKIRKLQSQEGEIKILKSALKKICTKYSKTDCLKFPVNDSHALCKNKSEENCAECFIEGYLLKAIDEDAKEREKTM